MAEVTAFRNNALPYPIRGCPYTIVYPFRDADGDLVTAATTPDAEISKNGDTFADCTNESTEIATGSGVWYLTLTGTELTTDVAAIIAKSATAGMKTTVAVLYPRKLFTVRSGTSASGGVSTSTIVLDVNASPVDDYYNGMVCKATIDSNVEVRVITDYVGSTQTCTVTPDWNVAPDNTDDFDIMMPEGTLIKNANLTHIAAAAVSTSSAQLGVNVVQAAGTAWNSGAIVAGTIAADAFTAAKFADGAFDSGVFAADAITSSALATSAVSEIATAVNAEVVDALSVDTYAEPAQGNPPATTDLRYKIGFLYQLARNKVTQTATEFAVYADDTTTKNFKATCSDDATTLTRGELATGA